MLLESYTNLSSPKVSFRQAVFEECLYLIKSFLSWRVQLSNGIYPIDRRVVRACGWRRRTPLESLQRIKCAPVISIERIDKCQVASCPQIVRPYAIYFLFQFRL